MPPYLVHPHCRGQAWSPHCSACRSPFFTGLWGGVSLAMGASDIRWKGEKGETHQQINRTTEISPTDGLSPPPSSGAGSARRCWPESVSKDNGPRCHCRHWRRQPPSSLSSLASSCGVAPHRPLSDVVHEQTYDMVNNNIL